MTPPSAVAILAVRLDHRLGVPVDRAMVTDEA